MSAYPELESVVEARSTFVCVDKEAVRPWPLYVLFNIGHDWNHPIVHFDQLINEAASLSELHNNCKVKIKMTTKVEDVPVISAMLLERLNHTNISVYVRVDAPNLINHVEYEGSDPFEFHELCITKGLI